MIKTVAKETSNYSRKMNTETIIWERSAPKKSQNVNNLPRGKQTNVVKRKEQNEQITTENVRKEKNET